MKKIIWPAILIVALLAAYLTLGPRLPIITGYAAKDMCSCVFLADRDPAMVQEVDLGFSQVKLAKTTVNMEERSASATVWGLARRTAIYREGYGCTLVTGLPADALRAQSYALASPPPALSDTLLWPEGTAVADSVPFAVNMEALNAGIDWAFDDPEKHTRSVVVVYQGRIIAERYAPGFDANTPQIGWSMSKSITNAMVGVLIKDGQLDVEQTLDFPEWKNDERRNITLDDLMRMSSGLEWNEDYGDLSDVNIMLFKKDDKAAYARNKPLEHEPGTFWYYSSGTSNILQAVIRQSIGNDAAYLNFPRTAIFDRIGMQHTTMEADPSGTLVGSSFTYGSARDWARFGLLYLQDGIWNGERILPEGWVAYSTRVTPASEGEYGAQVWLNRSGAYPTAPADNYNFAGYNGQRVFMIPSMDLIVVRLGVSPSGTFDFDRFLEGILQAFPEPPQ